MSSEPIRYLPKNPVALPANMYSLPETITRDLPPGFLEDVIARMMARGEKKRGIDRSMLSVVSYQTLADSGSLDRYTLIALSTARYYTYQAKMALFKPEEKPKRSPTM